MLARAMFRTQLRTWTKGTSSPVSEADIAVNDLIEQQAARGDAGLRLAVRGKRRRSLAARQADGSGSSIPSTARAAISPAMTTGASALHWSRACRRCSRRSSRRPRTSSSLPCAGRVRRATAFRCGRLPGDTLVFSRIAGPKPLVERLDPSRNDVVLHPRIGSLALRLCRVADGRIDAAFAGGQSHDWDLAAADLIVHEANGRMTSIEGEAILYNRAEVTHGVLVAAGHDSPRAHSRAFSGHPLP